MVLGGQWWPCWEGSRWAWWEEWQMDRSNLVAVAVVVVAVVAAAAA